MQKNTALAIPPIPNVGIAKAKESHHQKNRVSSSFITMVLEVAGINCGRLEFL